MHRERKERRSRQAVSKERGRRIKVPSIFVTSSAPKLAGTEIQFRDLMRTVRKTSRMHSKPPRRVREKVGCVDSEQSRVVNCLCDPGNGHKLYET